MKLADALLAMLLCAPLVAQEPTFDVVSIRPSAPDDWNMSMTLHDGVLTSNLFLKSLITSAYGVREGQIYGLPEWAESARYNVHAKVLDADPKRFNNMTKEQRRDLMASLLTERFHLRAHKETRILPRYELQLEKDGPKFAASHNDPAVSGIAPKVEYREGSLRATSVFMLMLVSCVEENVDRPVVDLTGLTGRYDFTLRWTPEDKPTTAPDAPPTLFTALHEQLGLRLHANKGPVEVLVVDHIDQPDAN